MSRLARLSLANRGLVALIAIIVTAFGLLTIPKLKQQLFPSLDFPAAFVLASYPGAAPEIVERQVTEPIENASQGVAGLEKVTSTSREGMATIQLEFAFGTDLDDAVAQMQTALNRIDAQLPDRGRPAGVRRQHRRLPGRRAGGQLRRRTSSELRGQAAPRRAAGDPGSRRGARGDDHRRPRPGGRDHPEPGQGRPPPASTSPRSPTALRANGVAMPAGTLTEDGTDAHRQVGTPTDHRGRSARAST